jgi:uncharacterized protein
MSQIQTHSGRGYDPLSPRSDTIHLSDIANALSNICRFTGHTRRFYSVAEHSVRVLDLLRCHLPGTAVPTQRAALLHDASEAYLCDLARPIKNTEEMSHYRLIEQINMDAVMRRFKLAPDSYNHIVIKKYDDIMLATERRYLLGPSGVEWLIQELPLQLPWWDRMGWSPSKARRVFLRRARMLDIV